MAVDTLPDQAAASPAPLGITFPLAANRDRLEPPQDPNLIHPGQRFALPSIPDDPQAAANIDTDLTDVTAIPISPPEPADDHAAESATAPDTLTSHAPSTTTTWSSPEVRLTT